MSRVSIAHHVFNFIICPVASPAKTPSFFSQEQSKLEASLSLMIVSTLIIPRKKNQLHPA